PRDDRHRAARARAPRSGAASASHVARRARRRGVGLDLDLRASWDALREGPSESRRWQRACGRAAVTPFPLLFGAGVVGGALNSVAGGGSFIVFPTMLLLGLPPVAANATTTTGLWGAGLASLGAYREHLPRERRVLVAFALASALGGLAGARLLLVTS